MTEDAPEVDVCLIAEGSYPYVSGGVSSWAHTLIEAQPDTTFGIVALLPDRGEWERRYELPPNVAAVQDIHLQDLAGGWPWFPGAGAMIRRLADPTTNLVSGGGLRDVDAIVAAIAPHRARVGRRLLLDSHASWDLVVGTYERTQDGSPFLEFYYTWRALIGALFAVLAAPLPRARVYHTLSTGYAGLLAARAALETGRPALLTEHGIYTNERRIEIAMADWIFEQPHLGFSIVQPRGGLKDLWRDIFVGYSRACYEAVTDIVTLFEGNQAFQLADGAPSGKMRIIPNGVDVERFAAAPGTNEDRPPTVAMVGRVVPIKDIKTFIRACGLLQTRIPDLEALILGPTDEDSGYFDECRALVRQLGIEATVTFLGKVRVEDYLGRIDAVVLTSISEGQPLSLLEAGAAGVPAVATDVGACREIVMGRTNETPKLGPGGEITPLANPPATADAMARLLRDPEHHRRCSEAIGRRVRAYYARDDMIDAYADLYARSAAAPDRVPTAQD